MFGRFITSLRQELTPLVEARLREELEPKIRAEIEAEARNQAQRDLESELLRRSEAARREMEQSLRAHASTIDRTLGALSSDARTAFAGIFDSAGAAEVRERLLRDLNLLVATRIESLRADLAVSIRRELEPGIRQGIIESLRAEVREEMRAQTEAERDRLLGIFREGLILQHVTEQETDQIRTRVAHALRPEVTTRLRIELRADVFRALLVELRAGVEQLHTERLISELQARLESDLVPVVSAELSRKLEAGVRAELMTKLAPDVEAKLSQQLLMPLLLSKDGTVDSTVAGVLRQNMFGMSAELRELVLDEIWEKVSTAIVGAVAAVADINEEDWNRYLENARELIDDRIQGSFRPKRRHLAPPDGFYRAVNTGHCGRTGDLIEPGECYVVFRGKTLALPLMPELADELVSETALGNRDASPESGVPPPWDGLPWQSDSENHENR